MYYYSITSRSTPIKAFPQKYFSLSKTNIFIPKKQQQQWQQIKFIQQLSSHELRKQFIQYFESNGHTPVLSSSLVPHQHDKSLLFTNAGGKHNDLDNVGYTPRHHTLFEMLGNFSFGQYSKEKAIKYAWNFLLKELELPIQRLRVTILKGDKEGYELWKKIGLTDNMILECGPEDNFWSMGDGEGPCGPCTEIFWDTQDDSLGEDRWLEIWNLVFMQNYRTADGQLTELPTICIDTGMGLERMACVLQGKQNNFQIDQFKILIDGLRLWMKNNNIKSYSSEDPNPHEKIIVDHFRSMCFLIGDGVVPSNVGRGYVLRRIIRRALRSARQLGIHDPFLNNLYPYLLKCFTADEYPELIERSSSIRSIVENEERAFLTTLDRGMALLDNVFNQSDLQHTKTIPPSIAFKLYDTYGFPFDLTLIIAQERGWTVDVQAVEKLQEQQKQMGKESWKTENLVSNASLSEWQNQNIFPKFTGYDHDLFHQESAIVGIQSIQKGKKIQIHMAIDPCPFYGLGGGQVPDTGKLILENGIEYKVKDVIQPYDGCLALKLETTAEQFEKDQPFLQVGKLIKTEIDTDHRSGTEVHHTATHLLNAGLRYVLQTDIVQAGSLVEPKKLRFDFTYGKPLTPQELSTIENWINQMAISNAKTEVKHMSLSAAVSSGAIATFSEKYGDRVRVIDIPGISRELCGGTHVDNIKKLYPFKILNETSVAAGTRRIEAVAGLSCIDWYRKTYLPIPQALQLLRANTTVDLVDKLDKTLQQSKDLTKKIDFMTDKLAQLSSSSSITTQLKDIPVKIHLVDCDLNSNYMTKRANVLRENEQDTIHVLVKENLVAITLNSKNVTTETANCIEAHVKTR
ncbi:unnamed protein product [Cunninghamella echinulata]